MQQRNRDRLDAYWRSVFGTTTRSAEPVITHHLRPDLREHAGIETIVRDGSAYISAPDDLVVPISRWQPTTVTATDPGWWHRQLPDWSTLGPSVHAFTDQLPPHAQRPRLHIESVEPDQLADLRSAVAAAQWRESGFAGDDIALAWHAVDDTGRTVAAANLTPFDGFPADVGVLTRPDARGHGAATFVAACAVGYAVAESGLARWRALTTNAASLRIAERLGFTVDCLHLAIRPPRT